MTIPILLTTIGGLSVVVVRQHLKLRKVETDRQNFLKNQKVINL